MLDLKSLLACPKCKTKINPKVTKCRRCGFKYQLKDGIWELFYSKNPETKKSQKEYDGMHIHAFEGPTDGSYEVLGAIAKGNLAVDIASGDGFIEEFSPETVAVEFSKNALKNANKIGAKYLVWADAHHLPFIDNAFNIAINTGNLEQFANPQKAISEMARISKIQVTTVHREFDFPMSSQVRFLLTKLLNIHNQPIEHPIKWQILKKMLEKANLKIIYRGLWTLPVNHGQVIPFLPAFENIPSCFFVITINK